MDFKLPIGDWADAAVMFLLDHAQWLFDGIDLVVGAVADGVQSALTALPGVALAAIVVLIGLWRNGWRFALFAAAALFVVAGLGMWHQTVDTLALVLTATAIALAIGVPLGIVAARNDRVETVVRPALDLMQTMPAFVYLIPAAMLFGLGRVPGIIATIIFAMPPVVRLTSLGIRQVPHELVEAGLAFGCTPRQLLFKVQMPTALPSIMAGINQTIMLSLSMVVIASMIGAGGVGNEVLRGIQRLDIGLGVEGGLAVVILAILLDRITQSFGTPDTGGRSPRSALRSLLTRRRAEQPKDDTHTSPTHGVTEAG
ncbi:glycine betaine/proline transport system permease protein [Azospirillum brasilense]|uniref:Glycine betaine/proline transport system permease protein n=1 Tax=Azospirillum brasilense TaxID=192 RepID=A0A560CLJ0_AZOBR|nr:proline/glycine betaine ABC transporter permease [Azospirillum brasilense]TWA85728.1 glycine betaine/proline transport system permease protein [Azospirillum brasilense]